MANRDAAAALVFLGQLADQIDVQVVRRVADVEMHVDVDVELAGDLEDTPDLAVLVLVVARRATDQLGAALEALDHQFLGAGIAGEAFLREHADLDVDRPFVVVDQRLNAVEAAHADAGIDLKLRAHAGYAVLDAFFECFLCALVYILHRHRRLDRRHAEHRAELAALLRRAAVDDARLVEMDVGFDQAGAGEVALRVIDLAVRGEVFPDRNDATLVEADVERLPVLAVGEPGIADDQVHFTPP